MKSFKYNIERKIRASIQLSRINIIDNTHKHLKHKSHVKNKLHLKLIIESEYLKNLGRIKSHKKIMNILSKEMKNDIHSLEIKIN